MRQAEDQSDWAYGCLYCRAGSEREIARSLERLYPALAVIAPEKVRRRRKGRLIWEERVSLFPGYIFIRTNAAFEAIQLRQTQGVFRVLTSSQSDWRLYGPDRALAEILFSVRGVIECSIARYHGRRIQILEGFLKAYEDAIVRVNRRAQTAQIIVELDRKRVPVWLGFELAGDEERENESAV